jgi:chemotaxis protein CheD
MHAAQKPIEIFVKPGEYFVGDGQYRIHTLLGSCVSIVLWHPDKHVGALSHFLLSNRGSKKPSELDARYGEEVMWLMLEELKHLHVAAKDCQGKIFGGGNMFPKQSRVGMINVGQRNGETARSLLHTHGISVTSESLFGVGHRRIIFEVKTGDVWVRQVEPPDTRQPEIRMSV